MATKKLPYDGFTLVEIMITIAIIATLAAISIPVFLVSRISANETAAIVSSRIITEACQSYYTNVIPHTYPNTLDTLVGPNSNPPYLDSLLGVAGQKQGYSFSYVLTSPNTFNINADPMTPGITGKRYFFTDETGVIRTRTGGQAGAGDVPVN